VLVQHLLPDGSHSAGFLNDLGVNIEDISFFEGKAITVILVGSKYHQGSIVSMMKLVRSTEFKQGVVSHL